MGGNSKGEKAPANSNTVAASLPAYLQNTAETTQPAGMPGQIIALAQQLGTGYGIDPTPFLADLNKTYRPAPTLDFRPVPMAKPVAKPIAKPAPKSVAKNSPLNMKAPSRVVPVGGRNAR